MRCKEIASDIIFDAMLWDGDAVVIREASPTPVELYIISLDLFAEKFDAIGN